MIKTKEDFKGKCVILYGTISDKEFHKITDKLINLDFILPTVLLVPSYLIDHIDYKDRTKQSICIYCVEDRVQCFVKDNHIKINGLQQISIEDFLREEKIKKEKAK